MSFIHPSTSPTFVGHPSQFATTTLAPATYPLQTTYQPQTISILNQQPAAHIATAPALSHPHGFFGGQLLMNHIQTHMKPKVTWRSEYIQVPKTIQVPQMVKQPQVIQVPKEIFETKLIPIQVPRIVQVPEEYEVDKTITVPKVVQEEREIRIPVPQMVKKTIKVPKHRVVHEYDEHTVTVQAMEEHQVTGNQAVAYQTQNAGYQTATYQNQPGPSAGGSYAASTATYQTQPGPSAGGSYAASTATYQNQPGPSAGGSFPASTATYQNQPGPSAGGSFPASTATYQNQPGPSAGGSFPAASTATYQNPGAGRKLDV